MVTDQYGQWLGRSVGRSVGHWAHIWTGIVCELVFYLLSKLKSHQKIAVQGMDMSVKELQNEHVYITSEAS